MCTMVMTIGHAYGMVLRARPSRRARISSSLSSSLPRWHGGMPPGDDGTLAVGDRALAEVVEDITRALAMSWLG